MGIEIVLGTVPGSSEGRMSPQLLTSNPDLPPGQENSLIRATDGIQN